MIDACLFAANVFNASYSSSFNHPMKPAIYPERTLYGTYPNEIWPGIKHLHLNTVHREAPKPLHLLMSIVFTVTHLLKSSRLCGTGDGSMYGLLCLGPISLGLHVAKLCNNMKYCFELRMLYIDALVVCKRYRESSYELLSLIHGLNLPYDEIKDGDERMEDEEDDTKRVSISSKMLTAAVNGRPGRKLFIITFINFIYYLIILTLSPSRQVQLQILATIIAMISWKKKQRKQLERIRQQQEHRVVVIMEPKDLLLKVVHMMDHLPSGWNYHMSKQIHMN
jgi:hypothetical protein